MSSLGKSLQAYAGHSSFGLTGSADLPSKMAWVSSASSLVGKKVSACKGNIGRPVVEASTAGICLVLERIVSGSLLHTMDKC